MVSFQTNTGAMSFYSDLRVAAHIKMRDRILFIKHALFTRGTYTIFASTRTQTRNKLKVMNINEPVLIYDQTVDK